jgi:hypothetical protein
MKFSTITLQERYSSLFDESYVHMVTLNNEDCGSTFTNSYDTTINQFIQRYNALGYFISAIDNSTDHPKYYLTKPIMEEDNQ